MRKNVDEIGSL